MRHGIGRGPSGSLDETVHSLPFRDSWFHWRAAALLFNPRDTAELQRSLAESAALGPSLSGEFRQPFAALGRESTSFATR